MMNDADRDLLLRSFDDTLSAEEQVIVRQRIASDPDAARQFALEQSFRTAIASSRNTSFGNGFVDEVMARVDAVDGGTTRMRLVPSRRVRFAVAASLLVAVAAGVLSILMLSQRARPIVVSAALGAMSEQVLPDGSRVSLNSGSTIQYANDFVAGRNVILEGEAFFDVVHDGSPFIVTTGELTLEVLGTTFNVRAWSSLERRTVVTLHSGSVEIHTQHDETITLAPGQRVTVDASSGLSSTEPDSSIVATVAPWQSGKLSFEDEPAAFVLAELERTFDTHIAADPGLLRGRRVTYLSPSHDSLESVLTAICHALGWQYRRTADGFVILSYST